MMDNGTNRQLLLIPFAPGMGDMVMMEPLIRAIRKGLPDWHLTMVAVQYAGDILQPADCELVESSYFVNQPPPALRPLHRLIPQPLIAMAAEPALNLDLGPFQRVINLFWVWERRVPFSRWWMPQWPMQEGVRHTVDLLADYLAEELAIEIPAAERVPRLRLFPEAEGWAADYWRREGGRGRPRASLVVSASNSLKWWAVPKWAELNDQLALQGWQTLLVAPPDNAHARQVYESCRSKPLWPETGVRRMAALLGRSDVVVGIDTGPLHMAAALGVPWVGLFGATNPDVIGPYDRSLGRAMVARFPKPASCKHCWRAFKNREERCLTLQDTGCTVLIPVQEVMEAVHAARPGTRIAELGGHRL